MALITVDELREHVETALEDSALQRILDGAQGDMDRHGGSYTADGNTPEALTETFYPDLRTYHLDTRSPIGELVSVTEDDVLLDDELYEVRLGGEIWHVDESAWVGTTVVEYIPTASELARRRLLLVNLSKLYINADPGTGFQGAATWQTTMTDFEEQKQRLLWAWKRPPVLA